MPCLENVIADIQNQMFPRREFTFEVERIYDEPNKWIVYMCNSRNTRAVFEFLIYENMNDPEDGEVTGSVLTYGNIPRRTVGRVMDSILERL